MIPEIITFDELDRSIKEWLTNIVRSRAISNDQFGNWQVLNAIEMQAPIKESCVTYYISNQEENLLEETPTPVQWTFDYEKETYVIYPVCVLQIPISVRSNKQGSQNREILRWGAFQTAMQIKYLAFHPDPKIGLSYKKGIGVLDASSVTYAPNNFMSDLQDVAEFTLRINAQINLYSEFDDLPSMGFVDKVPIDYITEKGLIFTDVVEANGNKQ